MKKRITYVTSGAVLLLAAVWFVGGTRMAPTAEAKARAEQQRPESNPVAVACPGRIEGVSDSVDVGAAVAGIVQTLLVKEGQQVQRGSVIAEIGCNDLTASLNVTKAEADSLRQARTRLLRGSRDEQRQEAAQKTVAAGAVLEQATTHLDRMQKLHEAGTIAQSLLDQARTGHQVADADLKRAMRSEELVNAPALTEEIARADADVEAGDQRIRLIEEQLKKCVVRAPISGTILRVHAKVGELFSTYAPRPLVTVADLSGRRVRAEVDERDLANIRIGQRVLVFSDAYPGKRFSGVVTKLSEMMGRKTVLTGNPADKSDRDVLETFAELDGEARSLPVGLRATVQFLR